MGNPLYLAAWSGPRNISTALMRAWGNRADTVVCDEPFYAHYLLRHGLDHPGRDEVLANHDSDAASVIAWLTGPLPEGKRVFYQKHMAHHLLPELKGPWLERLTHCLLIREPREMLTSLFKVLPDAGLADTGLPQQLALFRELSARPPVIDAHDVLENPRRLLGLLCEQLGVPFAERMLVWPPGRRATDGVWAKHWYAAVEASTTFAPYRAKREQVPAAKRALLDQCSSCYEELHRHRLR